MAYILRFTRVAGASPRFAAFRSFSASGSGGRARLFPWAARRTATPAPASTTTSGAQLSWRPILGGHHAFAGGVRPFSAAGKGGGDDDDTRDYESGDAEFAHDVDDGVDSGKMTFAQRVKVFALANGVMLGGGCAVAYGVSKMMMWVTGTFMHISFTHVAYYGFWTGMASAAVCGVLFHNAHKLSYIRPERVYKEALGLVRADPAVKAAMGASLKGGQMRAYKIGGGTFGLRKGGGAGWLKPRVQMLFQVVGKRDQAVVAVEAVKGAGGKLEWDLVAVDLITGEADVGTLLVAGEEATLETRHNLLGLVSLNKKYVAGADPSRAGRPE